MKKKSGGMDFMSKVIEAVKEASISVACLLDDVLGEEIQKDVEHIQNQITKIENNWGKK